MGLGLLHDPTVQPRLIEMMGSERSPATLEAIASALGVVGSAEAVAPLVALLDDRTLDGTSKAHIIDALGSVCDTEPLTWLLPLSHAMPYFAVTSTMSTGGHGLLELPR